MRPGVWCGVVLLVYVNPQGSPYILMGLGANASSACFSVCLSAFCQQDKLLNPLDLPCTVSNFCARGGSSPSRGPGTQGPRCDWGLPSPQGGCSCLTSASQWPLETGLCIMRSLVVCVPLVAAKARWFLFLGGCLGFEAAGGPCLLRWEGGHQARGHPSTSLCACM